MIGCEVCESGFHGAFASPSYFAADRIIIAYASVCRSGVQPYCIGKDAKETAK